MIKPKDIVRTANMDDSDKVIEYLEQVIEKQSKSQNKQFIITIIITSLTLIVSIAAFIIQLL